VLQLRLPFGTVPTRVPDSTPESRDNSAAKRYRDADILYDEQQRTAATGFFTLAAPRTLCSGDTRSSFGTHSMFLLCRSGCLTWRPLAAEAAAGVPASVRRISAILVWICSKCC